MRKRFFCILICLFMFSLSASVQNFNIFAAEQNGSGQFKPTTSDPIRYVSTSGSDSNDGLSWGSAKQTLWKALEALPGGSASPPTAGAGVVFIGPGVSVGAPDGKGLRFVGPNSSEYPSPATGWMKLNNALALRCINPNVFPSNSHEPQCLENWGSTNAYPAIQFNGTSSSTLIERFAWQFQGTAVTLGINSTGNRNDGGVQNIHFVGDSATPGSGGAGWGPQVDIGSNVFWIFFDDSNFYGNPKESWWVSLSRASGVVTATITAGGLGGSTHDIPNLANVSIYNSTDTSFNGTFTLTSVADKQHFTYNQTGPNATSSSASAGSDRLFGITVNPGSSGGGSGLIEINRMVGFGIKFYSGTNGGTISVRDLTVEGAFTGVAGDPPGLWLTPVGSGAGTMGAYVNHIEMADTSGITPAIVVDPGIPIGNVFADYIIGAGGCTYDGQMTLGGSVFGAGCNSKGIAGGDPTTSGARGIVAGVSYAQADDSRRTFGPVAVRFANIAPSSSSSWFVTSFSGVGPTCSAATAPDGTNNAFFCSQVGGIQNNIMYMGSGGGKASITSAVGDYYIYGIWTKSTANDCQYSGGAAGQMNFFFAGTGNYSVTTLSQLYRFGACGQWIWATGASKVTAVGTNPAQVQLQSLVDANHPITVYAPILLHIAAGTISDNEATQMALNLQTYGSGCTVNTICGLPGQTLIEDNLIVSDHVNQGTTNGDAGGTISIRGSMSANHMFTKPFTGTNAPVCVLTPTSDSSSVGGYWVTFIGSSGNWTGLTAKIRDAGSITFNYQCVGNPN